MMGLASAKMSQASLSSTSTNQIATKANSIANSDAELVCATAYNDLSAKTRQTVPDTGFQHEVILGNKSTVPDYRGRFLETDTTVGTVKEAGLPNITGILGSDSLANDGSSEPITSADEHFSGAFRAVNFQNYYVSTYFTGKADNRAPGSILFDASLSSPIYGASTTVQVASVTVRRFIKAA